MSSIVVIGSGLAGYVFVKELRKLSSQAITLLTQDTGEYYPKPSLSHAKRQNKSPDQLVMADAQKMAKDLNIEVITQCEVTSIEPSNRRVMTVQGSFSYDKLVLALGASPIFPQAITYDKLPMVVNNLTDYREFVNNITEEAKVGVLGAGLIGTEFAYDLSGRNQSIKWIFSEPWPLSRFVPKPVGDWLKENMAQLGISPINEQVLAVSDSKSSGYTVKTDKGEYDVDMLLQAFGIAPCIDLAREAKIRCNRGILTDRTLRTSDENIYALGDCAEVDGIVLQYVMPLRIQAQTLAKTLSGQEDIVAYPAMTTLVKTPLTPVAFSLPPIGEGNWVIEQSSSEGVVAMYMINGEKAGFALAGECAKMRTSLVRSLPSWTSSQ